LNITAILLKKVILEADSEIWARIRKHYLPSEYQSVYLVINNYFEDYGTLPSFDALKLSIRSDSLLNKIYALQLADDVDIDTNQLLEYLKNEYTQEEIMDQISKYLDDSIMMESAKENLENLHEIILHVEDRVELKDPQEDMGKMDLFDTEEDLINSLALGLNTEYDSKITFSRRDYILIGGKRGAGKSLTCSNIAVNTYDAGKSAIYFTIEMSARAILQRACAISTGVSAMNLKRRNLSHTDWLKVAKWWAGRFEHGKETFANYLKHQDFDQLHKDLTKQQLRAETQLDIVYEPSMSLATIRSELDKKVAKIKPAVILVDYVNQVKRSSFGGGQFDWTEQIEVSKALKSMAMEYEVPVISPYQIDSSGEARFAKGLLDSADAAFTLNPHTKDDECMTFECVKMRDADEISFTSKVVWSNLRIGPDTVLSPDEKAAMAETTGEESQDL